VPPAEQNKTASYILHNTKAASIYRGAIVPFIFICIVVYVPKIHLYSHVQTWCILNLILPIQRRNWLFWYKIRPWKFLLYEKKRILQNESKSCHTWKKIFSSQKMQLTDEIFCVYIQFLNKVKIFTVNSIWIKFSTYLFTIY